MPGEGEPQLRAWVDYFRDLGIHDFYRRGEFAPVAAAEDEAIEIHAAIEGAGSAQGGAPIAVTESAEFSVEEPAPGRQDAAAFAEPQPMKLISFNNLAPLPAGPVPA